MQLQLIIGVHLLVAKIIVLVLWEGLAVSDFLKISQHIPDFPFDCIESSMPVVSTECKLSSMHLLQDGGLEVVVTWSLAFEHD